MTRRGCFFSLQSTEEDYVDRLENRGKCWVCYAGEVLSGFAIADLTERNIWALFVMPGFENQGIGRGLHERLLNWSFEQPSVEFLWLTTAAGTPEPKLFTEQRVGQQQARRKRVKSGSR